MPRRDFSNEEEGYLRYKHILKYKKKYENKSIKEGTEIIRQNEYRGKKKDKGEKGI